MVQAQQSLQRKGSKPAVTNDRVPNAAAPRNAVNGASTASRVQAIMTNGREPNATGEMQSDYFEVESRKKCQYRLRRPAHQRCSPPTSSCAPDAVRPSRPAHQMMNTLARLCLSTECCCSCQLQVSVLRTRCSSTESSCVPDAVRPSRPAYQMTRCGSTEPSRVPEMRFDRAVPRARDAVRPSRSA